MKYTDAHTKKSTEMKCTAVQQWHRQQRYQARGILDFNFTCLHKMKRRRRTKNNNILLHTLYLFFGCCCFFSSSFSLGAPFDGFLFWFYGGDRIWTVFSDEKCNDRGIIPKSASFSLTFENFGNDKMLHHMIYLISIWLIIIPNISFFLSRNFKIYTSDVPSMHFFM